jgi:hypothetical protein
LYFKKGQKSQLLQEMQQLFEKISDLTNKGSGGESEHVAVQVVSVLAIMIQFLYSNELVKNRLDLT